MTCAHLAEGQVLFREGDPADGRARPVTQPDLAWHRRNIAQLLTGRARMAGQVNKQEDRHVEGSKRK